MQIFIYYHLKLNEPNVFSYIKLAVQVYLHAAGQIAIATLSAYLEYTGVSMISASLTNALHISVCTSNKALCFAKCQPHHFCSGKPN